MTVSAPLAREILGRKTSSELLDYWRRRADYPVEVQRVVRELLRERGETFTDAPELDVVVVEVPVAEVETVDPVEPWLVSLPITRLIGLSILSLSMFEAYWMYENWRVLRERDRLDIWPFWRAVFGVFFCHDLFRRIHADEYGRRAVTPQFAPGRLATIWIVMVLSANLAARFPGLLALVIAVLMPSYLCFAPVQNYINQVYAAKPPERRVDGWSRGQIAFAVGGALLWLLILIPAE